MGLIDKWAARCMARLRASSPRAIALGGGLCLVVLAGAVWLVVELSPVQPAYRPLTAGPMDAAELALATSLAESGGIDYRVANSRLMVAPEHMDRLAAALEREGSPVQSGSGGAETFEQLVSRNDIWSTQAQSDKRWQAAKMAKLGSLISQWPRVRRATVIIEPGSGSRLGRLASRPTSAVHITLAQDARVDAALVAAIGDLVSGSVIGMAPEDVRIVDSTGRSYRPGDEILATVEAPAEQIRRAEAYYAGRIRDAIDYIPKAVVSVSVVGDDGVGRCTGASVSVPRSYLAAAMVAVDGNAADPTDAQLDAFAADRLARVQRVVTRVAGIESGSDAALDEAVKVDWYYDAAPSPVVAAPTAVPANEFGHTAHSSMAAAGCWSLALLGCWCGLMAYGRGRMLRRLAQQSLADQADASSEPVSSELGDPLARLREAGTDQLRTMLAAEHPQTQALILAQVSPEIAAEVLADLGSERQVDVSRRIAALGRVEPAVVGEALRGLIEQWTDSPGQAVFAAPDENQTHAVAGPHDGGVGKMARILNHVGGATEKAVLDGLTGMAPALAESIRTRMFVFDDVALLPRTVLRIALESLGSDELAIALRTASAAVTDKMLSSLPRVAAGKVRDEMARIGPVRLSDVEAAQERVVAAVRRLEDGLYTSSSRDGSEMLA